MANRVAQVGFVVSASFLIAGCGGSSGGNESKTEESGTSQVSTSQDSPWQLVDVKPQPNDSDKSGFRGFATVSGDLYVGFANHFAEEGDDASGVWRYDGTSWELVWKDTQRYLLNDLVAGSDGNLYVERHANVLKIDAETGDELKTITEGTPVEGEDVKDFASSGRWVLLMTTGALGDEYGISAYNTQTQTWKHADISTDRLSGKTGKRSLAVDNEGALWVGTQYQGVLRAGQGQWGSFEQVAPRKNDSLQGGELFRGADGEIHLSYEKTAGTQLSGLFRWTGSGWEQLHENKGYAIEGIPMPETGVTVMLGGRFPVWAFDGTLKWPIESAPGSGKDQNFGAAAATKGTLWAQKDFGDNDDGYNLLRLDVADVKAKAPYDANLDVATARHLNGIDRAKAAGIEILADGRVVAGVNDEEGNGTVAVLSEDGSTTKNTFAVGEITDLAATPDGDAVLVATEDGIKRIKSDSSSVDTLLDTATADRLDVDANGNIATIENKTVMVRNQQGDTLFSKTINWSYVKDVTLDAGTGNVYVVGFSNDTLDDGSTPVQTPYLRAYEVQTDQLAWSRFGFSGDKKGDNIADARLYRVEVGQDGELYILGESAGSQTTFRYDGTRLSGDDILTKIDHYNDLWDTGSAHIAYHARVDKDSGDIQDAQLTMARRPSDGKSNTFFVNDIASGANGRTFIVGETAAALANRSAISLNGEDVPDYSNGDAAFMALRQDFSGRLAWHSLDNGGASAQVMSVATRDGRTVLLSQYDDDYTGDLYITQGSNSSGGSAVHVTTINHEGRRAE